MKRFILSFCFLTSFCIQGAEEKPPQKIEQATALDRLKIGATRYVALMDVAEFTKWKKNFQEMLNQKTQDSKLTEDAVITQYILDYATDYRKALKGDPEKADPKFILDLARHLALGTEKNFVWKDWTEYEKEIGVWADWFLKVTDKP